MTIKFPAVDDDGKIRESHLPTRLEASALTQSALTAAELSAAVSTPPRPLDMGRMTADNAYEPLVTPTYDGSGQAVHPSVIHIPGGFGPQKFPYWMGMTPYPDDDYTVENPSILASHDGETWVVPDGMTNPIAEPETQYYPDPDLTYDPLTKRLYCVWYHGVGSPRHFLSWTENGFDWSAPFAFTNDASVSPTVLREHGGLTLWDIGRGPGGTVNKVRRRTGPNFHQVWTNPYQECDITLPEDREAWHIEVQKIGAQYIALISAGRSGGASLATDLFVALSHDGVTWTLRQQPIIARTRDRWDSSHIYRASLLPTAGTGEQLGLIYYSARSHEAKWHIGKTPLIMGAPDMEDKASLTSAAIHTNVVEAQATTRNLHPNPTLMNVGSGGLPTGVSDYTGGLAVFGIDQASESLSMTLDAVTGHTESRSLRHPYIHVTPGESYAISFEATTNVSGHGINGRIMWMGSGFTYLEPTRAATIYPEAGKFGRIKLVAKAPADAVGMMLSMHAADSPSRPVTYFFRRVQVEKSDRVTEWTPGVADRTIAAAGQTTNLSEWLTPVTTAGQKVMSAVNARGAFIPPKSTTDELPAPTDLQGALFWDTAQNALVMSNGTAWVKLATV